MIGDYKTGVALLADLFLSSKNPIWVHNQARCYQQNGRFEEAILSFSEYLRKAKQLTPNEVAAAEKHIADCEAAMARQARLPRPAPSAGPSATPMNAPASTIGTVPPGDHNPGPAAHPTPSALALPGTIPLRPPSEAAPGPAEQLSTMPTPAKNPSNAGLRTAGIVTGAAGLVAAGAGLWMLVRARNLRDQIENDSNHKLGGTYNRDTEERRQLYADLSWVGFGTGIVGVLTGFVLYGLGSRSTDSAAMSSSVKLQPSISNAQSGITFSGNF